MKKLLVLVGAMSLLLTTAKANTKQTNFILNIEDAVYYGTRSGDLTKKEVRVLNTELNKYERTLWKYEKNGKLSRREKRKLNRVEKELKNKLDAALRNHERTYTVRKQRKAKVKNRKQNQILNCGIV